MPSCHPTCSPTRHPLFHPVCRSDTPSRPASAVYEVHAGMLRRDSWSPYEQSSLVTHIVRHDDFDAHYIRNDMALFRLQTPFHLNR